MLRKFLWYKVLTLLLLAGAASVWAQEPVKIGADFGLSGSLAAYGAWVSNGVNLALDEVNSSRAAGKPALQVIFEDNRGQPAEAVSAYRKLRNIDHAAFVMTYQSSIALAIAPLANRDQVVQMDVSAFSESYSTPDDYTFRTGVLASELAEESARIMEKELNIRDVAILYINNEKGVGGLNAFRENFHGRIGLAEPFELGQLDYRPVLLRVKKSGSKAVWITGHLAETGQLLRQAAELALRQRFFSDVYSIEGDDFLRAAGPAAEGMIYAAPKFRLDAAETQVASFVQRYRQRYHENPNYMAAQAYDGMLALAKAIYACEKISATCAKHRLYELDFEGASGRINFDRNGDVHKEIEMKVVRQGRFAPYRP